MPKYDVTAYPILAVRIANVEADSPQEAIRKAEKAVDWGFFCHAVPKGAESIQDEDFDGWLVDLLDEKGHPDYECSQLFDGSGRAIPL